MLASLLGKKDVFARHFTRNCLRFDGFSFISIKKQYISQNIQVGAGHLRILADIFSSICGTFFLGIPDQQFNLGHCSFAYRISSMTPCKYTTDRIRTRKAIAEVIKLRDNIYRSSGTLAGSKFTKASERLQYLLLLLRYWGVDTSRL